MNKIRSVQLQAYLDVTGTTKIITVNIHTHGPKRVNDKRKDGKLNIEAV